MWVVLHVPLLNDSGSRGALRGNEILQIWWPPFTAKLPAWWRGRAELAPSLSARSHYEYSFHFYWIWQKGQYIYLPWTFHATAQKEDGFLKSKHFLIRIQCLKNNILNVQVTIKSHWSHEESGNHNVNEKR